MTKTSAFRVDKHIELPLSISKRSGASYFIVTKINMNLYDYNK